MVTYALNKYVIQEGSFVRERGYFLFNASPQNLLRTVDGPQLRVVFFWEALNGLFSFHINPYKSKFDLSEIPKVCFGLHFHIATVQGTVSLQISFFLSTGDNCQVRMMSNASFSMVLPKRYLFLIQDNLRVKLSTEKKKKKKKGSSSFFLAFLCSE